MYGGLPVTFQCVWRVLVPSDSSAGPGASSRLVLLSVPCGEYSTVSWSGALIIMSPSMKWGDILFLTLLSVRLSVCPSRFRHNLILNIVWLYFVSALYLLNPWWDLQITLHKCQVWWDDVRCLCLTKVGSRSRSQSKIKHCKTVFCVRSITFEPLVGVTNNFAQMSSMMGWCAVPMFDQGRFKVKVTI